MIQVKTWQERYKEVNHDSITNNTRDVVSIAELMADETKELRSTIDRISSEFFAIYGFKAGNALCFAFRSNE